MAAPGQSSAEPNCTGTLTIGSALHFDLFIAPSGNDFTYIHTNPRLRQRNH
jgi:hypothetical protein